MSSSSARPSIPLPKMARGKSSYTPPTLKASTTTSTVSTATTATTAATTAALSKDSYISAGISKNAHASISSLPPLFAPDDTVITIAYLNRENRVACYVRSAQLAPTAQKRTSSEFVARGMLNVASEAVAHLGSATPTSSSTRFSTVKILPNSSLSYLVTQPKDGEMDGYYHLHTYKSVQSPPLRESAAVASSSSSPAATTKPLLPSPQPLDATAAKPLHPPPPLAALPPAIPLPPPAAVVKPPPSPQQVRCTAITSSWRAKAAAAPPAQGYVSLVAGAFCF